LFLYDTFKGALKRKGIREIKSAFIDHDTEMLPKDSKIFSSLYRTFVFEKSSVKRTRPQTISPDDVVPFIEATHSDLFKVEVERDRSSFIRATIRALIGREYTKLPPAERLKYVENIRFNLASMVEDIGTYADLNQGEIEMSYTEDAIHELFPRKKIINDIERSKAEEHGNIAFRIYLQDDKQHLSYEDIQDLLSRYFKINIVVLKGNGEIVRTKWSAFDPEKKITIILIYDGVYYTVLARKVEDEKYITKFDSDDNIVERFLKKD